MTELNPESGVRRSLKAIFNDAAALAGAKRAAFLERVCGGDEALRARVERMLRLHDEAGPFMEAPTDGGTVAPADVLSTDSITGTTLRATPLREGPGARIGPYKLLQQVGEGGFGVVFMAEQSAPIVRRVALKIIKLGMDTKQVIARFEAERQALAMMDHPNIAKVLDAGATDTGRPYFVMELVRGVPVTQYCDANNLTAAERLALFIPVCQAVQHAHQKGVIHRDLKPSNILVTLHDGRPVPKVIDFGIAKATNARLTEKTLFTDLKAVIGTPAYMSPEQAELSGLDIDTRSDVYSLGVLLYELLTGTPPFDPRELLSAGYAEMQRIIREVEPPRPSTRVTALGGNVRMGERGKGKAAAAGPSVPPSPPSHVPTLATIAARRRIEPHKLSALFRGDLDWIVMKCLEKDRRRRYDAANDLAADVQRHLSGEPVLAAPPSMAYRVRKFVRRYRGQVAAAAIIGCALVVGAGVATWGLIRAEQANARLRKVVQAALNGLGEVMTIDLPPNDEYVLYSGNDPDTQTIVTTRTGSQGESFTITAVDARGNPVGDLEVMELLTWWAYETTVAWRDRLKERNALQDEIVQQRDEALLAQASMLMERAGRASNVFGGSYCEAQDALEDALSIRRSVLGDLHPDVEDSIARLAELERLEPDDQCLSLWEEALDIRQQRLATYDTHAANYVKKLISAFLDRGEKEAALDALQWLVAYALETPSYQFQGVGRSDEILKACAGYEWADSFYQDYLDATRNDLWDVAQIAFIQLHSGRREESKRLFAQALEIAGEHERDAYDSGVLIFAVWQIVSLDLADGIDDPLVERAVGGARSVVRIARETGTAEGIGDALGTLGVALYRWHDYGAAVVALCESDDCYAANQPSNWAFLAMSHFKLGQLKEARAALARLREVMPQHANDEESQVFLREAEALIDGAKP